MSYNSCRCFSSILIASLSAFLINGQATILSCDFEEEDLCDFVQDTTDTTQSGNDQVTYEWTRYIGRTPSANTGPSEAQSNSYYLYMESGGPWNQGDYTRIATPQLGITEPFCLDFYYHMYVDDQVHAKLNVLIQDDLMWSSATNIFSAVGNQGNIWINERIDYTSTVASQRIVFQAVRGANFRCDIAIDNINITTGSCRDSDDAVDGTSSTTTMLTSSSPVPSAAGPTSTATALTSSLPVNSGDDPASTFSTITSSSLVHSVDSTASTVSTLPSGLPDNSDNRPGSTAPSDSSASTSEDAISADADVTNTTDPIENQGSGSPQENLNNSSSNSTWWIIGIIIGSMVLIWAVLGLALFISKRRNDKRVAESIQNNETPDTDNIQENDEPVTDDVQSQSKGEELIKTNKKQRSISISSEGSANPTDSEEITETETEDYDYEYDYEYDYQSAV